MYPLYILLYLTMARNTRTDMQRTILTEYIPLTSHHHLYVLAGAWIGILSFVHSVLHLIRWGVQGSLKFCYSRIRGVTGVLAMAITPLLVMPMRFPSLQKAFFEVRKRWLYPSWVWAIALALHVPASNIFLDCGDAHLKRLCRAIKSFRSHRALKLRPDSE